MDDAWRWMLGVSLMKEVKIKRFVAAASLLLLTAGCARQKVQDPLFVKGSTALTIMPARSSKLAYHQSSPTLTSTPVAYEEPPTMAFADRTLYDNLSTSLEMADYLHGLRCANLVGTLSAEGPYTVFAIPNRQLEVYSERLPGGLMNAQNQRLLQRLMAFTIVPGNWNSVALDAAMQKLKAERLELKTLSGDGLIVARDKRTGVFHLENETGQAVELWLADAPQSNGTLYFTNDVLPPASKISASTGPLRPVHRESRGGQPQNQPLPQPSSGPVLNR